MIRPDRFHRAPRAPSAAQGGATLIEALVSVLILLVALLGTAGLIARSSQSEMEAYQRVQALTLLQDMVARLNANRQAAACYASGATITTAGSATVPAPLCASGTAAQQAMALADLAAWGNQILGNTESNGGNGVGAMIGALGCIEALDPVNRIYRVTVAWQGLAKTAASALPCGSGRFGDERYRRAISVQVQMGVLS